MEDHCASQCIAIHDPDGIAWTEAALEPKPVCRPLRHHRPSPMQQPQMTSSPSS